VLLTEVMQMIFKVALTFISGITILQNIFGFSSKGGKANKVRA
jgi:hypothetical protein